MAYQYLRSSLRRRQPSQSDIGELKFILSDLLPVPWTPSQATWAWAYMSFPPQHRAKLHSTNPLERLIGEIKRRTGMVGVFPNQDAITRLVGALLLEQNDEWAVQRGR